MVLNQLPIVSYYNFGCYEVLLKTTYRPMPTNDLFITKKVIPFSLLHVHHNSPCRQQYAEVCDRLF